MQMTDRGLPALMLRGIDLLHQDPGRSDNGPEVLFCLVPGQCLLIVHRGNLVVGYPLLELLGVIHTQLHRDLHQIQLPRNANHIAMGVVGLEIMPVDSRGLAKILIAQQGFAFLG